MITGNACFSDGWKKVQVGYRMTAQTEGTHQLIPEWGAWSIFEKKKIVHLSRHCALINPFGAETHFRRQNLTSTDVRF